MKQDRIDELVNANKALTDKSTSAPKPADSPSVSPQKPSGADVSELPSPIRITKMQRGPYEAEKTGKVNIYYINDRANYLKTNLAYSVFVIGNLKKETDRHKLEEDLWDITKKQAKEILSSDGVKMPLNQERWNTMQGPVLTKEQANQLQSGNKTALYYMGIIKYVYKDGQSGAIEFCGFFMKDPMVNFACQDHND